MSAHFRHTCLLLLSFTAGLYAQEPDHEMQAAPLQISVVLSPGQNAAVLGALFQAPTSESTRALPLDHRHGAGSAGPG